MNVILAIYAALLGVFAGFFFAGAIGRWAYAICTTVRARHVGGSEQQSRPLIRAFPVILILRTCVLLINLPLIYVSASGSKVDFSVVVQLFLLRHVVCFVAAYPVAKYGNIDTVIFAVLFVGPSLLLVHGIFIWESNGMLELWPPI